MSHLAVANEIRNQLGGMAFAMMGAKNLAGGDNFLQFSIGDNEKKISKICIRLDPSDTYTVSFYDRRGNIKHESNDVYCDMLHDVIEENTGLYLSFAPRKR